MENKLKPCPLCYGDEKGRLGMVGAFSLRHSSYWIDWYLECGSVTPIKIQYCPICGRNLNPKKEVKDDEETHS